MKKNKLSMTGLAIATALLTGCGGSSGSNSNSNEAPAPAPPPANTAPETTADSAQTLNGDAVILDVLANDIDADGDTLTITSVSDTAENGTVEIDDGTLVYTPKAMALGADSFTYEISDGEDTASAEVTITNQQSLVLTGLVTDNPVANADVSVSANDQTFSTEADESGQYTLTITLSSDADNLMLTGTGKDDESHIALVSPLGSFTNMLSAILENEDGGRTVTSESNPSVIVSHVSTASVLLYDDYAENGGDQSYEEFVAELNNDELMSVAGFIKLLADNPAYTVPEGETTYSLFNRAEGSVTETSTSFLKENGFLNEDGTATDAYESALQTAIEETLSDERLAAQYSNGEVAGEMWAQFYSRGDIATGGSVYSFSANGTGTVTDMSQYSGTYQIKQFDWAIVDGAMNVVYTNGHETVSYIYCGDEQDDSFVSRWGEEAAQTMTDMCEAGEVFLRQPQLTTTSVSERFLKNAQHEGIYRATRSLTIEYKLELNYLDEDPVTFSYTSSNAYPFKYADMSSQIELAEEGIAGSAWATYLSSQFEFEVPDEAEPVAEYDGFMWDQVNFAESNTLTTMLGEENGTWSVNDGILSVTVGDETIFVRPFKQVGERLLALFTGTFGEDTVHYVAQLVPANIEEVEEVELVTELPVLWTSYINSHHISNWNNDQPAFDILLGFNFNQDGTYQRCNSKTEEGVDMFSCDYEAFQWQWAQDGNAVTSTGNAPYYARYRDWRLLSQEEGGTLYVLEWFTWVFHDDFEPTTIPPRLNLVKKLDWQTLYPDAWEASIQTPTGLLPSQSATEPGLNVASPAAGQ